MAQHYKALQLRSTTVSAVETRNELTFVNTNEDGNFAAFWLPSATGNLLIKAVFDGNNEYSNARSIVSLAIAESDEEESLFSVSSNSTLSELYFNTNTRELSFSVSGENGTTVYVDVYIPKTLMSDISGLKFTLTMSKSTTQLFHKMICGFSNLHIITVHTKFR